MYLPPCYLLDYWNSVWVILGEGFSAVSPDALGTLKIIPVTPSLSYSLIPAYF